LTHEPNKMMQGWMHVMKGQSTIMTKKHPCPCYVALRAYDVYRMATMIFLIFCFLLPLHLLSISHMHIIYAIISIYWCCSLASKNIILPLGIG